MGNHSLKATFCKLKHQDRQGSYLSPYDDDAKEAIKKFSDGELVVIDIKKTRNPKFHRLAFAMMRHLYDMVDESMPFENWRKLMLIKAGYFTSVGKVDIKGTVSQALIPDSIAYEKMDEIEFQECMNNFIQQFIDKYGRQITYEQLAEAAAAL